MYIDEELLSIKNENPSAHLNQMLKSICTTINSTYFQEHGDSFFKLLESINFINLFCAKNKLPNLELDEENTEDFTNLCLAINSFYKNMLMSNIGIHAEYFETNKYKFTEDEYNYILDTLTQLKKDIKASSFPKEHKNRIIEKLNKFINELDKEMSNLDKAQEAGITIARTLGQIGVEAKPFFDRINETLKIVFRVQDKGDNTLPCDNQLAHEEILKVEILEGNSND